MQYAKGNKKEFYTCWWLYSSVINKDRDMKIDVWYRLYLLKNE